MDISVHIGDFLTFDDSLEVSPVHVDTVDEVEEDIFRDFFFHFLQESDRTIEGQDLQLEFEVLEDSQSGLVSEDFSFE